MFLASIIFLDCIVKSDIVDKIKLTLMYRALYCIEYCINYNRHILFIYVYILIYIMM